MMIPPSITNARCAHVSDGGRCQRGDANIRTQSADDNEKEIYAVTENRCDSVKNNKEFESKVLFLSVLLIHTCSRLQRAIYLLVQHASTMGRKKKVAICCLAGQAPYQYVYPMIDREASVWPCCSLIFFIFTRKPMTLRLDEKCAKRQLRCMLRQQLACYVGGTVLFFCVRTSTTN